MPVIFKKSSSGLDTFSCGCCGEICPFISKHEHHRIKKSQGGLDTRENIELLCTHCHTGLHSIESALKNDKRRNLIPDLLEALFPNNPEARKRCLYLAKTAAIGQDTQNPQNKSAHVDYSQYDSEDLVHLTPPKVTPQVKELVMRVCRDLKPTGRALGVSSYLKLLVEQDLRKRGYRI